MGIISMFGKDRKNKEEKKEEKKVVYSYSERNFKIKLKHTLRLSNYFVYPDEIDRVDVVAEKDNILYGFEAKMLGLTDNSKTYQGIGQTLRNHLFVNKSYLAIPENALKYFSNDIKDIFKEFKIGLMVCKDNNVKIIYDSIDRTPKWKLSIPIYLNAYKRFLEGGEMKIIDIKREFGMSAVWKMLNRLQKKGLIEIVKKSKGYRLKDDDVVKAIKLT